MPNSSAAFRLSRPGSRNATGPLKRRISRRWSVFGKRRKARIDDSRLGFSLGASTDALAGQRPRLRKPPQKPRLLSGRHPDLQHRVAILHQVTVEDFGIFVKPGETLTVLRSDIDLVGDPLGRQMIADGGKEGRDALPGQRRNQDRPRALLGPLGCARQSLVLVLAQEIGFIPDLDDALVVLGIDAKLTQDALHVTGLLFRLAMG